MHIKNKKIRRYLALAKYIIFSSLFIFFSTITYAQESEVNELSLKQLLLMPDKLTQPHAKLESQCNECHLHFDKSNQSPLCLDCHEKIQQDLNNKTKFHSSIAKEKITQCNFCHTDHKGRDFDITSLDIDRFNHDKTEFKLKDSHQTLECKQCHTKEHKNYRIKLNDGLCSSCHEDIHREELKNDCAQCHNEKTWQVENFDHSKVNFNLKGKHQELACQACHTQEITDDIGDQCVNCHRGKDKHLAVFGDKCQSCHSEKTWAKTDYNHFVETNYRLAGKHEALECNACHFEKLTPPNQCNDCHQDNDVHLGNNGTDCQNCHDNDGWSDVSFDHNKETSFPIIGAHEKLSCNACHVPNMREQNEENVRTCNDCHELTDPHQGKLGKNCQNCHQQQRWNEQVTFNHDFTLFPLTGSHQLVICQSCHQTADYKVNAFGCNDCHSEDDYHQATLGNKCVDCHNTSSWSTWHFDHQKQSKFPLKGAHKNLACDLCHTTTLATPLFPAQTCISCHKQDDVHQGNFGRNCKQCHNMENFNDFKY